MNWGYKLESEYRYKLSEKQEYVQKLKPVPKHEQENGIEYDNDKY